MNDKGRTFQAGQQHGQSRGDANMAEVRGLSALFLPPPAVVIIQSAMFKCLLYAQHFWGPESSRDNSVRACPLWSLKL